MSINVTHDARPSGLQKTTLRQGRSTDAFAQVMQAHMMRPETPRDVKAGSSDNDRTEESVFSESLNEEDAADFETDASSAVVVPQVTANVMREGGAANETQVKTGNATAIPLAFMAQGWQSDGSKQQDVQPALAPPSNLVALAGQAGATESQELLTREAVLLAQGGAAQAEAKLIAETQTAKAMALEAQLPRDAHAQYALQDEPPTVPPALPPATPMIKSATEMTRDISLQTESGLFDVDEIEMPHLGGGDRAAPMPIGLSDAKLASQAQVATAVAQQLAVAVQKNPNGVTELVLNPEELGRVRLSMSTHNGVVALTITTERPETQDLMRRHIETLAQELRDLGFDDVGFSFRDQGQGGQSHNANEQDVGVAVMEVEPNQPAVHAVQTSGLDLRL